MSDSALKDIAKRAFNRANWDANPTQDSVDICYGFVNDALGQLSVDMPVLFFDDVVRFTTQPDAQSTLSTDLLIMMQADDVPNSNIENPWVFFTTLNFTTTNVDAGMVDWKTDRSWDGRFIDFLDENGDVVQTNQIRSAWQATASFTSGGVTYTGLRVWISLLKPFPWGAYGVAGFSYRVYTPEYFLPDDVIEVRSMRVVGQGHEPMTILSQLEAEERGIVDANWDGGAGAGSEPTIAYRRRHFQLPAPNVAPAVEIGDPAQSKDGELLAWKGPEPPGEFEYCITYTWGKRDIDYQNPGLGYWETDGSEWTETAGTASSGGAPSRYLDRMREPLWESGPSPASSAVTVSAPSGAAVGGVVLTLPNIEYMLGFMMAGDYGAGTFARKNNTHSGWHVRIYRRRKSANFTNYTQFGDAVTGQSIDTLHKLDIHDAFYLLAETRIDQFNEGYFLDNGTIVPDYLRRLRDVNGYQAIRLHPQPDARYEIEARVVRRPLRLVSDRDCPPVHPEAIEPLVNYTRYLLHTRLGEPSEAANALALYRDGISTIARRHGDLRPANLPIQREPARVRGYTRRWPWWLRPGRME